MKLEKENKPPITQGVMIIYDNPAQPFSGANPPNVLKDAVLAAPAPDNAQVSPNNETKLPPPSSNELQRRRREPKPKTTLWEDFNAGAPKQWNAMKSMSTKLYNNYPDYIARWVVLTIMRNYCSATVTLTSTL
jgi:hypothetical protein